MTDGDKMAAMHLLEGRAALARGDLIAAYDAARSSVEAQPTLDASYLLVLTLARMGDQTRAAKAYSELGVDQARDVDSRALGARLVKDSAELLNGEARLAAYRRASVQYEEIYRETGDPFPGVNAASLAMLGGDPDGARALASSLLSHMPDPTDFWSAATYAEALTLLDHDLEARDILLRGLDLPGADAGARSSLRHQLDRLATCKGLDPKLRVRGLLKPGAVIFYCGHMFVADEDIQNELSARIDVLLQADDVHCAFGALACGTDILFAERLLARGAELNVVLPFDSCAFKRYSVAIGGKEWLARFDQCLNAASTVHIVSRVEPIGDQQALRNSAWVAMGLARLRAKELDAAVKLMGVWDGQPARGNAGTAVDIAQWQQSGGTAAIIDADGLNRSLGTPILPAPYSGPPREIMSILFADIVGFAKTPEVDLPWFWNEVMGSIAKVLDKHAAEVRARNSWGDAIFAMVDGSAITAEIALAMLERLPAGDFPANVRIGIHHGAVYSTIDPVTKLPTFYGNEISRASRIEPVTPPGEVYVTQSFAAALAMEAPDSFHCSYMGLTALAKNYGTFPMYRLTRLQSGRSQ